MDVLKSVPRCQYLLPMPASCADPCVPGAGLPHAAARALVKWLAVLVAAKDGREATWARGRDGKPSTFATLCKEAPWMPTSLKSRRPAEVRALRRATRRLCCWS